MAINDFVIGAELGPEFEPGTQVPGTWTIKVDGVTLIRDLVTGELSAPGATGGLPTRTVYSGLTRTGDSKHVRSDWTGIDYIVFDRRRQSITRSATGSLFPSQVASAAWFSGQERQLTRTHSMGGGTYQFRFLFLPIPVTGGYALRISDSHSSQNDAFGGYRVTVHHPATQEPTP